MTPDLLAIIEESKRLDSAADSGPWATKITGSGESQYCDIVQSDDTCAIVCVMSNSDRELDNAEFIAHARTALPALVAEVERLQRVVDQANDHNSGLEREYSDTQEAISELANAMGIDAEARWDHDSCPNNSEMIRELYAELKARES